MDCAYPFSSELRQYRNLWGKTEQGGCELMDMTETEREELERENCESYHVAYQMMIYDTVFPGLSNGDLEKIAQLVLKAQEKKAIFNSEDLSKVISAKGEPSGGCNSFGDAICRHIIPDAFAAFEREVLN